MEHQLIETWNIHQRVNHFLLEAIPEEALSEAIPKNRTIYDLFAHIHNVRLMWIKAAAPALMDGLEKLEPKTTFSTKTLHEALQKSAQAIDGLLQKAIAENGRVKNFKPHVVAFLGYLISHESHHRGQIGWTLKYHGRPLDKKTAFGLWAWGVR